MEWNISVNETRKRSEIQNMYGGQRYGGIATPTNSENILIFTDLSAGAEFGYDKHEGQGPDGIYHYTGAGQRGDMTFTGVNKVMLESPGTGKIIRLFLANSPNATYKGSFTLADQPFTFENAPDRDGTIRRVIVFNLTPIDADTSELPEFGGAKASERELSREWSAPNWESYLATQRARGFEVTEVSRAEHRLQADFGKWLMDKGHTLIERPLKTGNIHIFPDLFDRTSMTVFEAKRSSGRGYVRTALGQVLDYQHVAKNNGLSVQCGLLFPGAPVKDLIDLCSKLKVEVYVRKQNGEDQTDFVQLC